MLSALRLDFNISVRSLYLNITFVPQSIRRHVCYDEPEPHLAPMILKTVYDAYTVLYVQPEVCEIPGFGYLRMNHTALKSLTLQPVLSIVVCVSDPYTSGASQPHWLISSSNATTQASCRKLVMCSQPP